MLAPPMYRTQPIWYQNHLPELSVEFSRVFSLDQPANLSILTSFYNQNILDDGSSLNPVSGLHFLLHLFDDSERILSLKKQPPLQQNAVLSETARSNRDRITLLEHDHFRLGQLVDQKVAADSEFNDWVVNRAEENWLTLQGLGWKSLQERVAEGRQAAGARLLTRDRQALQAQPQVRGVRCRQPCQGAHFRPNHSQCFAQLG